MKRVCNKETIGSGLGRVWTDLLYQDRHNNRKEQWQIPHHNGENPFEGYEALEWNP